EELRLQVVELAAVLRALGFEPVPRRRQRLDLPGQVVDGRAGGFELAVQVVLAPLLLGLGAMQPGLELGTRLDPGRAVGVTVVLERGDGLVGGLRGRLAAAHRGVERRLERPGPAGVVPGLALGRAHPLPESLDLAAEAFGLRTKAGLGLVPL